MAGRGAVGLAACRIGCRGTTGIATRSVGVTASGLAIGVAAADALTRAGPDGGRRSPVVRRPSEAWRPAAVRASASELQRSSCSANSSSSSCSSSRTWAASDGGTARSLANATRLLASIRARSVNAPSQASRQASIAACGSARPMTGSMASMAEKWGASPSRSRTAPRAAANCARPPASPSVRRSAAHRVQVSVEAQQQARPTVRPHSTHQARAVRAWSSWRLPDPGSGTSTGYARPHCSQDEVIGRSAIARHHMRVEAVA